MWQDTLIAEADRHQAINDSMRALARREPTFALHVHVGLGSAAEGIAALNQMRAHVPVLLALSANSPYWQGRDTGLASARTPLFQSFPRVGIPRLFSSYADWFRSVNLLISSEALPDTSYLWWDVRLQPGLGTVEVRIMDAQTSVAETAALAAFVQCLVRLELLEGYASSRLSTPRRCSTRTASSPHATASTAASSTPTATRAYRCARSSANSSTPANPTRKTCTAPTSSAAVRTLACRPRADLQRQLGRPRPEPAAPGRRDSGPLFGVGQVTPG